MHHREFRSNADLADYLVELSGHLRSKGQPEIAAELEFARQFAGGSPSEFLHEAQRTLKRVKALCARLLCKSQLDDVERAVEEIDLAFKRIGGA